MNKPNHPGYRPLPTEPTDAVKVWAAELEAAARKCLGDGTTDPPLDPAAARDAAEQFARLQGAASPGPWKWDRDGYDHSCGIRTPDGWLFMGVAHHPSRGKTEEQEDADAAFVAASRNSPVAQMLLRALAEVERVKGLVEQRRGLWQVTEERLHEAQAALHNAGEEVLALRAELKAAQTRCEGLAERVAKQSELLSRRAERPG